MTTVQDLNLDSLAPGPVLSISVAIPDFLGPQFSICKTRDLGYWSLNPLSSKMSKYFLHYHHPFPYLLPQTPPPPTVILLTSLDLLPRDL